MSIDKLLNTNIIAIISNAWQVSPTRVILHLHYNVHHIR